MTEPGQILIADDEDTFVHSTADLLGRSGYRCDCARDATAAAQKLQQAEYDLLIADIKMPGNPDLDLIRDLPSRARGMPVILVTGYPSLRTAIQSIELPVVAYMVKPLNFEELLARVRTAIERHQIYRAIWRTREQLQQWSQNLRVLEDWTSGSPRGGVSSVSTFFDLTFRNMLAAFFDLRRLTEAVALQHGKQDACHLLQCPRPVALTEALREAIAVLEKTKSAFRSNELRDLRIKLEKVIASSGSM